MIVSPLRMFWLAKTPFPWTPDCRTWIRLAEGFLAEVKFEFFITGCCQKTINFRH
jgi:hypothetical protein